MAKERPLDPGCTDPLQPPTCLVQPPVPFRRLADPCGTVALPDPCTIDPTQFQSAAAEPATLAAPVALLRSVQLGNLAVTRTCAQSPGAGVGIAGASVTIAAGALTREVPLSSVTDITEAQRTVVAGLSQPTVDGFAAQTALQIAELTTFTLAQATALKATITSEQLVLAAQAVLVALAGLECYYPNAVQVVTCAPDSASVAADSGVITITVAADTVRSATSVAAANLEAQSLGSAQLQCRWTSTAQTATCPSAGAVVGTVTVSAATLTSAASRADANAQALALATSQLDCRYANAQQTATCGEGAVAQAGLNPFTVSAGALFSTVDVADANAQALIAAQSALQCQWASAETTKTCPDDGAVAASPTASPVYARTVPAGTFTSTISQADADAQAELFALAQLDCRYCNTAVDALCTVGDSYDATAAVDAGTFCESTAAAAQNLAEALAAIPVAVQVSGTPTCHYSNDRVTAACVAAEGVTVSKFTALAGVGLSLGSSGLIVVEAGALTSIVSKADANTQARALALASLNCFFESEAREFGCTVAEGAPAVSPNATQPFTVAAGFFISYTSRAESNALRDAYGASLLDCFWDSDASSSIVCAEGTSPNSYPPFGSPVTLAAGFFTSYTSKVEANALRDAYAASLLDCFWDSAASGELACDADAASGSYPPSGSPVIVPAAMFTSYTSQVEADALMELYAGSLLVCFWKNAAQTAYCDDSETTKAQAPNSVTVAAGTLISLISQADADALATALAAASRVCIYANDKKTGGSCGVGTTQLQTGSVEAGTILASSKTAANSLAQTLANALNVCVNDSVFLSTGSAGSQGPSGNCTSNCGAFYS